MFNFSLISSLLYLNVILSEKLFEFNQHYFHLFLFMRLKFSIGVGYKKDVSSECETFVDVLSLYFYKIFHGYLMY